MDHSPITDVERCLSGECVLITGGTGFLGKVLTEKLLRSCAGIKQIYLLARHKKGVAIENRFQEIFKDPLFCELEKQYPNFREKVTPILADCSLPGLGLSQQDKELLISEVGVVFHSAATVRFDESLRIAYDTNVRGTKELLLLAKQMTSLKAYVHISTAYSNCNRSLIEEKLYKKPIDYKKLELLVDNLDDNLLQFLTPKLLLDWPNTYTFTKAVAESVVDELGRGMPLVIFRPGIVVGTAYEPLIGWTDNVYGPTGLVVGAGCGLLHSLQGNVDGRANVIPVDMTVAAIIVVAADLIQNSKALPPPIAATTTIHKDKPADEVIEDERAPPREEEWEEEEEEGVQVVNYVSEADNPLTWRQFKRFIEVHGDLVPTVKAVWCYFLFIHKYRLPHLFCVALFHYLPAVVVDTFAFLTGAQIPNMVKIYKKVDKFSDVLSYFGQNSWEFRTANVNSLWSRLNAEDQKRFRFDISALDWNIFFYNYIRGLRVYLIKDDMSTLPRAKVIWYRFKIAHAALKLALLATAASILYSVFFSRIVTHF